MKYCVALTTCLLSASSLWAEIYLYVSVAGDQKIMVFKQEGMEGKLKPLSQVGTDGEPAALAVDPQHRFLFASMRSTGKLSSFRIDPNDGSLTHLSTVPAGPDPAHIAVDRDGRFLFCAYYVAAQVTVHAIDKDGILSKEPKQTIKTADKAHALLLDPTQRVAFVPHTGPNLIFQFTYDADTGTLKPAATPTFKTPPGTGPRHLVYHPRLKDIVYVANEQGGSVTAYRYDAKSAALTELQTLSTLPADFKGNNACAEIRLHPNGKFLYVSNRGHDSIAGFQINSEDGKLTALGQTPTEKTPRSFDIDPAGRFLYAAGEGSGKLATLQIDGTRGALKRIATQEAGPRAWWALAVDLGAK